MKRLFSKFGIMILACAFGITATAFWFYFNPKMESYEEVDLSKIPTVKQQDLKNEPQKYDGKIVRLQANLYFYQHGYFFAGDKANGESESERIAIIYYEPRRDEIFNSLKRLNSSFGRLENISISVIGRFSYDKFSRKSSAGNIEDRTRYIFEIFEIENTAR